VFVDYAEIEVESGRGGDGCVSFRREKYVPKGGPDGGDGGEGGDVMIRADSQLTTLLDFRYRRKYKARKGENGSGALCRGRSGEDLVIKVPLGTLVKDNETGEVLGDLSSVNQEVIVAKGGTRGRGNAHFATSTDRAPKRAEPGGPSQRRSLVLELKLLADVGLVGKPNAGKSTLLGLLSSAHPKIADYPFTTLRPNLGIVKLHDFRSFVMADIPGLIEGAHRGKGLGVSFLRHIERTKILVYLVDSADSNPRGDFQVLKGELEKFSSKLAAKPAILAFNKADLLSEEERKSLTEIDWEVPFCLISAVTGEGKQRLLSLIARQLEILDD
jgi:GTP-binding protein